MVHWALTLPPFVGATLFAIAAIVTGLATYAVVHRAVGKQTTSESTTLAIQLFRVVATLLALLLSLTFADVRIESAAVDNSIRAESALLADIFKDLTAFDTAEAAAVKVHLIEYVDAVIGEEWLSLRTGEINEDVIRIFQALELDILKLEPMTPLQNKLHHRLIADIDAVSDSRTTRLVAAGSSSPTYLSLAFLGFLWSTALLGACSTRGKTVFFIGAYCAFVGIVIYYILALDHPFDGIGKVTPAAFELLSDYAKRL